MNILERTVPRSSAPWQARQAAAVMTEHAAAVRKLRDSKVAA